MTLLGRNTPNSKMAVARDDLERAGRKRGIEGQETTMRHFGIRCMINSKIVNRIIVVARLLN